MSRRICWRYALLSVFLLIGAGVVGTTVPDRVRAESPDDEEAKSTSKDETSESAESSDSSTSSFDHGELTSLLPGTSKLSIFVDVEALKTSTYYDRIAEWLEKRSTQTKALSMLKEKGGIELTEDIEAVAFGFPAATPSELRQSNRATVALEASFDREKLKSVIEEAFPEADSREVSEELTVHTIETSEVAIMEDRVVITSGSEDYRNSTWKTVSGGETSLKAAIDEGSLLEGLEDGRSFWMLNRGLAQSASQQLSGLDSAVVGLHLKDGLDFQMVAHASSEEASKAMKTQLETLKQQSAQNPMLGTIGATPLIDNLKLSLKGDTLVASTSMTSKELDTLVKSLEQLARSRMKRPAKGGSKTKPSPSSSGSKLPIPGETSSKGKGTKSSESDDETSGKDDGVDADFN